MWELVAEANAFYCAIFYLYEPVVAVSRCNSLCCCGHVSRKQAVNCCRCYNESVAVTIKLSDFRFSLLCNASCVCRAE